MPVKSDGRWEPWEVRDARDKALKALAARKAEKAASDPVTRDVPADKPKVQRRSRPAAEKAIKSATGKTVDLTKKEATNDSE